MAEKLGNEFLDLYLEYVEETETPRLMHIWSALSGVGAVMGRRIFYPFGPSTIFGNQYVFLVGPPGVKKSTAISIMKSLVKKSTNLKFAPKDTGGQRQGLIRAMAGDVSDPLADKAEEILETGMSGMADAIGGLPWETRAECDKHVLYGAASELNSLIGEKSHSMLTFLLEMWDGNDDYEYQLKNTEMILEKPLLSIIGGTTPTNIVTALPVEAMGQGFMSRVMLVFGNQKYKRLWKPPLLDQDIATVLCERLAEIYHMEGAIEATPEADAALEELYDIEIKIDDPRFVYYIERRQVHHIKASIVLAVMRGSLTLERADVLLAHKVLQATEKLMPEALGEFGLSPVAAMKQKLLEFLQHNKIIVPEVVLWTVMHKDMRHVDFKNVLIELVNAGKILHFTKDGQNLYMYNNKKTDESEEILGLLAS